MARLIAVSSPPSLGHEAVHPTITPFAPLIRQTYNNIALESSVRPRGLAAALQARDLGCPSGAHECSEIDTRACCLDDQYCEIGVDASITTTGCCASGSVCGGTILQCASDQVSCPIGGGCCAAGFSCAEVGCVAVSSGVTPASMTMDSITELSITPTPQTPSAATSSTLPPGHTSGGSGFSALNVGGQVGSIVGAVAGLATLGLMVYLCVRKRRSRGARNGQ